MLTRTLIFTTMALSVSGLVFGFIIPTIPRDALLSMTLVTLLLGVAAIVRARREIFRLQRELETVRAA